MYKQIRFLSYLEKAAFGREGVRAAIVLRPAKNKVSVKLLFEKVDFLTTNLLRNMMKLQKWFKSEKVGKIIS